MKNQRGMTMIEIMFVLVIIGAIGAALSIGATNYLNRSRVSTAQMEIREIGRQLELYNADCHSYPSTEEGLQALVSQPGSCRNWGPTPYLRREPRDPWGRPYVYFSDGGTYELKSLGRDGREGGEGYDAEISNLTMDD